ncbi:MAG: MFS transporter [Dehalococcoidia bacterium]|nr:MFS transporter [Dehalococcoidia bacterium]
MSRLQISRPWIVLGAGFVVIAVGYAMRNTFTVFYPVLVDEFGWTRGVTAVMFSITLLTYGLVAPLAGGLVDHFNPKLVLVAGGLFVGSGVVLCSLATQTWHFYLLYGVLVAVGLSLIGVTPMSTIVADWFPRRRALVFSIIIAGFGISLVTAPIFQALISRFGWQNAYVLIGATAVAIIVPFVLIFIRRNRLPAPVKLAVSDTAALTDTPPGQDWTLKTALPTRPFQMFLLISFCNMGFAQQFSIAHSVYMMQDMGYAPMTSASVFGAFGISFAAGTLASALSDRLGRTPVFVGGCLLATAGILLLKLAGHLGLVVVALLFCISTGFGLGLGPPTAFAAAADRFHGRNYGSIQGMLILSCSLGGALGPWLGAALHDIIGTYELALVVNVAILLLSGVTMWRVQRRRSVLT